MWCPNCKQTRPQEMDKRQFSRKALAACVGIVCLWGVIALLAEAFGAGRLAEQVGIFGGIGLFFFFLTVGFSHAEITDVFAQFRCPECDAKLVYGRPAEDEEVLTELCGKLEASKKSQQVAEQKAEELKRELDQRSTDEPARCPSCQSPVGRDASFCGRCGKPLQPKDLQI